MTIRSSIFGKLLLTSALLIGVTLASAYFLLTRYVAERERSLVQQQMAQSLRIIAPTLAANPPQNLQKWAEDTDAAVNARVTLIDSSGVVVADSRHDPETMQNHRERPEVSTALAGRPGSAFRLSATLDVEYYYYAEPVESPGRPRTVLRLAVPLTQVDASIAAVRILILRASAVAALLALLLAYLVARAFTRRIRRIENYAKELVNADYSGTLAAEGDDELGSVARSLRTMAEHFRGMLARLAQESSRREAILGSMVEGILAVERSLRITFYNEAFARAVHANMPPPDGVSLTHVVRDPALGDLLSRVISTGKPARERMCLISAEGRIFQVQAAPLDEPGGRGAIATFHDITELERLERTRKDFVANVSHELRTPLAAIRGYAETLLEGALDDRENSRRFLEIIAAHSVRISNLASDLLTLSEIEAERVPAIGERISALELVENALQRVATQANERKIRVSLNPADDVYVVGQKGRLERAVSNLLLNAINFNSTGGEVRIEVRSVDATARISIADDGIGIAPQDLRRIFERFYRVDKARSTQTGGTGLGLSIVKNTMDRAGGSIIVDSQLGKGSVFTLVFPAA